MTLALSYTKAQTADEDYNSAVVFFTEANNLKLKYDFDNAEDKFRSAAELFKKHDYFGNYIQSMYSVGDIYLQKNKFSEAESIFNEIDSISVLNYGNDNQFQTNIFFGKGTVYFYKGNANKALEYFKMSLELNKKFTGGENFFESVLLSSIGNTYSVVGEFDKAMTYYEDDLKLKKKLLGENNPSVAAVYNNLALTYKNRGNYDKALEYIDKAIKLSIDTQGENNETANYYTTKGNIYSEKGQYDLALDYIRKSLAINKSIFGNYHKSVSDNLNSIGIIENKQGKPEAALFSFKDAYAIQKKVLGDNHPDLAMTCNNIGYILEIQGKYESSLIYFQEAVDIKSFHYGSEHPEIASYYNNIGINYYNRGMYDMSMQSYTKAQTILEKKYGTKFPGLVRIYANKADVYRKLNNYKKSLEYYQKSIAANIRDFKPDTADYYTNPPIRNYYDINKLLFSMQGKAMVLNAMYMRDSIETDLKNAFLAYMSCDTVISIAGRLSLKKTDKISLNNRTKEIYEDAIITTIQLSKIKNSEKDKNYYLDKAFYFSEKNKAGILSQAISASQAVKFAGIPEDIINKEKEYQEQITMLEKMIAESSDNTKTEVYKNLLFEYNNKSIELTKEIEQKYPKYYNSKYSGSSISIKNIQSKLDKNSALRSYFEADEQIIIFSITKNDIKIYSSQKPKDFDKKIKDFLAYTTSGYKSDFPKYAESAHEIFKILFPETLNTDIKNITVIGDKNISLIPFDALLYEPYSGDDVNFKEYPYLIKKYKINYFYSADFFTRAYETKSNNTYSYFGLAPVFNNLVYSNINGFEVTPLPGSLEELSGIEKILNDKNIEIKSLVSNAANENAIKSENLKKYNFIHIATHGVVNTEYPELSGLIMYPTDNNDDILYSGEIYNLELDADLVVLSACRTGIGQISKSEGIIGLPRSLLYAGARNIIVSMWSVSDTSTSELMIDFYKNIIEKNQNFNDALYNAKLKMIDAGGNYAHPFFWSPFVLIGK